MDKWNSLKEDSDHVSKKNKEKRMPSSSDESRKAKPSDLGSGQARRAAEALIKRNKEIEAI